jgi:integrase
MRDRLSDVTIRNAKPRTRDFKISDGGGLHLLVKASGSKLWRLRYRFEGRESMLGLGRYDPSAPEHVSLSAARERRDEAMKLLSQGINPSCQSAREKGREAPLHTFEATARLWMASREASLAPKYAAAIHNRLERLVFPAIGSRDIASINAPDILALVKKIEAEAVYLARRMKIVIGQVFRFGIAHGWCERDPSRDIADGLAKLPRVRHRAALKVSELPDFFRRLEFGFDGYEITKLAMRFIILTAVRTDELRFATWPEIEDLEGPAPLWRIPPERMKKDRPHLVPLSPEAVSILRRAKELYPQSRIIFPSLESRTGHMSENCLLYAIYHLGLKGRATTHGFRSTFSTALNENGFNSDWIELQLAHAEDDPIRAAYNAAQWLPQRREMMNHWASYVEDARNRGIAAGRFPHTT